MKFRVHTFEEIRHSHEVEAETKLEAVNKVLENPEEYRSSYSERTGDLSDDVCVDPLTEDGSIDFEGSQWFKVVAGVPNGLAFYADDLPE